MRLPLHRHAACVSVFFALLCMGGVSQAQFEVLTSPPPPVLPARIFVIEPINDSDARIGFFIERGGSYRVLASASPEAAERVIGTGVVAEAGIYYWTDSGVLKVPGQRYYRLGVSLPHEPDGTSDRWALYVQERISLQRYLVSLPVDPGPDNTLSGPLGTQLMYGLAPGANTNDADALNIQDEAGEWQAAYLAVGEDNAFQWRQADMKTPSSLSVQRGSAFWIIRHRAPGWVTSKGIFAGPLPVAAMAVRFRTGGDGITPFGLTGHSSLFHRNTEAVDKYSTPPNQLGFYGLGSAGATADIRRADECGDQIWVWCDNEWWGRYWLMGHLGEKWDGRWWDSRENDFANFALNPGQGYYYVHRTNRWGGTEFEWTPNRPSTR
ncbi:MAG: hypothetical protein O3C57_03360 [Verrucomicrobia bacterium]|nr:hypothetical protein [Verrucomicrobiota bacterium]